MIGTVLFLAAGTVADGLAEFPRLERLVREAGLMDALRGPGHWTVLAPPADALDDTPGLAANHVIDGALLSGEKRYTLHGELLSWADVKGARGTGDVRVCSNGLIVPVTRAFAPEALGKRVKAAEDFRIRMDAPLPEGWPRPGPLDEVRMKRYPGYRLAVDERGDFGTLFRHIKKREIAMTAPVEMDAGGNSMAFLYRFPEQGEKGRDGRVEIRNEEPRFALSVGIRGKRSGEKVEAALKKLRAELAKREGWRAVEGGVSVFGFNSPFILPWNRYWEVAMVVEPVAPGRASQRG